MKTKALFIIATFALILTACAGTSTIVASDPTPTPGVINTSFPNALPVSAQLAIGTINLTGANAITKDEATNLLFLWKGLKTVSSNTTPVQAEMEALLNQIHEAMSQSQLQAISDMKLTQVEAQKIVQDLGLNTTKEAAAGTTGTQSGSSSSSSRQNNNGGFPGGDFGGGPGGIPGTGLSGGSAGGSTSSSRSQSSVPSSAQATIQARTAQRSQASNVVYYNAVIAYLEQLVAKS